MKRLIYLCIVVCLFTSCDPAGTDEYYVVNNTSSSIVVVTGDSTHIDTLITVPAGQMQLAFSEFGIGRGFGPDQQTIGFRRLYDVKKDNLSCKKDIKQLTNWEIIKIKKPNGWRNGHSITNFSVRDSDY
ncbi:MAG: hypothetical protein JST82_10965 [Bacteroidetes bacterium]|nr:hypothetical protein [Bacteroidota bacterium]